MVSKYRQIPQSIKKQPVHHNEIVISPSHLSETRGDTLKSKNHVVTYENDPTNNNDKYVRVTDAQISQLDFIGVDKLKKYVVQLQMEVDRLGEFVEKTLAEKRV